MFEIYKMSKWILGKSEMLCVQVPFIIRNSQDVCTVHCVRSMLRHFLSHVFSLHFSFFLLFSLWFCSNFSQKGKNDSGTHD